MSQLQFDQPDFRQRARPVGFDIAYKIEDGALLVDQMRKIERVPLASVEQVRFTFQPGNIVSRGFRTQLRIRDGRSLTFGNVSWRSLVEVERQEASYRAFTTRLAGEIARANPECRFVAGKPPLLWALFALLAISASFGMALFAWTAWTRGQTNALLFSGFLFVLGVWQIEPMVRLNRPRKLATGEVPQNLLP
jgi:hypothetical protein